MNSPFVLQTKSLAGLGSQSQSQSQGQSRVHSQGSQGKSRHKGTCKTRGKGAGRQLNLALSQVTLGSPVEGMLLSASKGVHVPHREDNHNIVLEGCTQSQDFFCTPDFITPSDVKLPAPGMQNEWKNPPTHDFTPLGCKRPRSVIDAMVMQEQTERPLSYTSDLNAYKPPGTKRVLRRIRSPPCFKNPFSSESEEPVEKKGKDGFQIPGIENKTNRQQSSAIAHLSASTQNDGRYRSDFKELSKLGKGSFSTVYRCKHRLDGCEYAIKQISRSIDSQASLKQVLQEVQAYSVLGSHENILRYHTSWIEDSRLYIQLEYASGGCIGDLMMQGKVFDEDELTMMLWVLTKALDHLHSHNMAHMDVKPDNIHIVDSTYKLADFGVACRIDNASKTVFREGDSRYMAPELLQDNISKLDRADIFALGAAVYELARNCPLPTHGDSYRSIREGKLTMLPAFSVVFQEHLKSMMRENLEERPSAAELLKSKLFDRFKTCL